MRCRRRALQSSATDEAETDALVGQAIAQAEADVATLGGVREILPEVRAHLEWMAAGEPLEPYDEETLEMVEACLDAGELPTNGLRGFLVHELIESRVLREDLQEPVHDALRRRFGDFANYPAEVVKTHTEQFNPNWQAHWSDDDAG